jgi:DNA-binding LacI/PurR family transcriptional regulator
MSPEQAHVATIRDVADAANVSITTVSHVFNRPDRVAKATRRRVYSAAVALAYRPNVHARQLVTRRSSSLAIQVAGHFVRNEHALVPNSEYFLEVLNGASRAAAERGYALILTPPDINPYALDSFAVDGVLLIDPSGDEPVLREAKPGAHIVTTGRPRESMAAISVVDNDHQAAAITVMEHLWERGYRRPAVIVDDRSRSYVTDILAGYRSWARQHHVRPVVIDIDRTTWDSAFARLATSGSDAVYTSTENIALDLLQETPQHDPGPRGPWAVVSAVDSSILRLTNPQITGVFLHPRKIGERAVEVLIDLVSGRAQPGGSQEIPTQLMCRGSTESS